MFHHTFCILLILTIFALFIGKCLPTVQPKQQQSQQNQRHSREQTKRFPSPPVGPARPVIRRAPFIRPQNEQMHTKSAAVAAAFAVHPPAIRPPKGMATKLNQAKLKDFFSQIRMKLQKA
ncbi:hypothetical protein niasHT_007467 [Heterodera trifolii]|uniref:Uncharacterized protein n=1 Tax=Heterodera trifolii TaxID=157864 RepID=A0ABD2LPK8_9BILA